jgi:hypothetical protein
MRRGDRLIAINTTHLLRAYVGGSMNVSHEEPAMKRIRILAVAAVLAMAAGVVPAQPGRGVGPGPGASTPSGGPGGMGRGMGGRWGADFTAGWSMMTPQERQDHQARMRSMTNYDGCRAYMDQHHQQMVERARQQGRAVPSQSRRDACVGLKR